MAITERLLDNLKANRSKEPSQHFWHWRLPLCFMDLRVRPKKWSQHDQSSVRQSRENTTRSTRACRRRCRGALLADVD